jgi:very-short-patch-repair endonuclease
VARRLPWGRVKAFGTETPALVGIINRIKDWKLLQSEHWYRIPKRSAPEGLEDVRYLAWYQTKVFGEEKWSVNWYARVLGITERRRAELLPDEPGHKRAEETYFRIEVSDLLRLPNPIPSRNWRFIVFIPTSLERLLVAQEINDLFRTSPIEDHMYRALVSADMEPERQFFVSEAGRNYELDMALFCRDGRLDIECDGEEYHAGRDKAEKDRSRDNALASGGWKVLRFSGREILDHTGQCMRVVRRTVKHMGGVGSGPKRRRRV